MFTCASHSIRQLEKRNVANEVEIMLWCNRMDLVALANVKGTVKHTKYTKISLYYHQVKLLYIDYHGQGHGFYAQKKKGLQ